MKNFINLLEAQYYRWFLLLAGRWGSVDSVDQVTRAVVKEERPDLQTSNIVRSQVERMEKTSPTSPSTAQNTQWRPNPPPAPVAPHHVDGPQKKPQPPSRSSSFYSTRYNESLRFELKNFPSLRFSFLWFSFYFSLFFFFLIHQCESHGETSITSPSNTTRQEKQLQRFCGYFRNQFERFVQSSRFQRSKRSQKRWDFREPRKQKRKFQQPEKPGRIR